MFLLSFLIIVGMPYIKVITYFCFTFPLVYPVSASMASATAEPAVEMRQRLPEQVSPLPAAVDLVTQAPPKGQQTPTGARFDPNTGRPIPKFDPQTGVQNW